MRLLSQLVEPQFLHRPDVFRRDALELTFQIVRGAYPDLALLMQNALQGIPLETTQDTDAGDALQVRLQRPQITAICLALHRHCGVLMRGRGNAAPDFARECIVVFALLRDWEELEASDYCD